MALSHDRNTPEILGTCISLPVAANTLIYAGALVALNAAGYVVPGAVATTLKALGRAEGQVINNPGLDGAQQVRIKRGAFKFKNSDADPVTKATVYSDCYIADDQTVAATNGTNTRSKAGKVIQLDTDGVWVEIR